LSPNATRKYMALFAFLQLARAQGLVVILVGHVVKNGNIAGPKTLEHVVDAVLYIRRAFRLRPFFVYKSRFGPEIFEPIVLTMDDRGCLIKSPLSLAKRAVASGYSGVGQELVEVQAAVTLPKFGSRPQLVCPFLPEKRIRQLLGILSAVPGVDLGMDLNFHISCYLPNGQRYSEQLDVPIALVIPQRLFTKISRAKRAVRRRTRSHQQGSPTDRRLSQCPCRTCTRILRRKDSQALRCEGSGRPA